LRSVDVNMQKQLEGICCDRRIDSLVKLRNSQRVDLYAQHIYTITLVI
jgi:hypothetical protein